VCGQHDDRRVRELLSNTRRGFEAFARVRGRHPDVDDREVGAQVANELEELVGGAGLPDDLEAGALEQTSEPSRSRTSSSASTTRVGVVLTLAIMGHVAPRDARADLGSVLLSGRSPSRIESSSVAIDVHGPSEPRILERTACGEVSRDIRRPGIFGEGDDRVDHLPDRDAAAPVLSLTALHVRPRSRLESVESSQPAPNSTTRQQESHFRGGADA
jgi:hypothetical protein